LEQETRPTNLLRFIVLGTTTLVLWCQGVEVDGLRVFGGVDETEISIALEDKTVDSIQLDQMAGSGMTQS
jgi:hypothetical protein